MSNEQLRVFVKLIADRIEIEVGNLANALPDEIERRTERHYVGSGLSLSDKNPDNWVETPGVPVVLDDLYTFLGELREMEETLKGEPES